MRTAKLCVALALLAGCLRATAVAEIPRSITVQGRLTDSLGVPLPTGVRVFTFKIFDSESAGNELWPDGPGEFQDITTDTNGLWTAIVGSKTPIPEKYLADTARWLEITVEDSPNPPLTLPRVQMTSGAFVYHALTSEWADTALAVKGGVGGAYLPLAGGTMTGPISNTGDPSISMGKANFGSGNTNPGANTFVAGTTNSAEGDQSSVCGGQQNTVTGTYGVISGGRLNSATGINATVGGGLENSASGDYSVAGGGRHAMARGQYAVVSGGGGAGYSDSNAASADWSTVGGGRRNVATFDLATVSGGWNNQATDSGATVAGGVGARATGKMSTISGGRYNRAAGDYAVVAGGGGSRLADSNSASGDNAAVLGGLQNIASGDYAAVLGGLQNSASGSVSSVTGGLSNLALAEYSGVGCGWENEAHARGAYVAGGQYNRAYGSYAVISGGGGSTAADSNFASGRASTISGGSGNTAQGREATVGGGTGNGATAQGATVAGGGYGLAEGDFSTIAGGNFGLASGNYAAILGGRHGSAIGNYSAIGGGYYNRTTGLYSVVSGGGGAFPTDSNAASGLCSSVSGGRSNRAGGDYSFVAGGLSNAANGDYSFAGGRRAYASSSGCFVWGDATDSDIMSSGPDQFLIRASGGVGIGTNSPGSSVLTVVNGAHPSYTEMIQFRSSNNPGTDDDILSIEAPAASPTNFQFIECERIGDIEFRVHGNGDVTADGTISGGGADFAEMIHVSAGAETVTSGDVMVIDPSSLRSLSQCTTPRSTLVAGICSTSPGFIASPHDWDQVAIQRGLAAKSTADQESVTPPILDLARAIGEVPLAVIGIVPCKVSTENGAIHPGDLLVTSSTPGHAMRDDNPRAGTILGKALGSLDGGTGTIEVLVTLQ